MRKLGTLEELSDKLRSAVIVIDRSGVEYPQDRTNIIVLREFIIKALDARIACNILLEHLMENIAARCKCLSASTDLDYLTEQFDKITQTEYFWSTAIKNRSEMYQELIEKAKHDISNLQLELAV